MAGPNGRYGLFRPGSRAQLKTWPTARYGPESEELLIGCIVTRHRDSAGGIRVVPAEGKALALLQLWATAHQQAEEGRRSIGPLLESGSRAPAHFTAGLPEIPAADGSGLRVNLAHLTLFAVNRNTEGDPTDARNLDPSHSRLMITGLYLAGAQLEIYRLEAVINSLA
jgi:hypothetical protein